MVRIAGKKNVALNACTTGLLVLLCFFLFSGHKKPAFATPLWNTEYRVPCVMGYCAGITASLASIGARLDVLQKADAAFRDMSLMKFLTRNTGNDRQKQDAYRRMALIATAYPVQTHLQYADEQVLAKATIQNKKEQAEVLLRQALQEDETLNRWAEVLILYEELLREGLDLVNFAQDEAIKPTEELGLLNERIYQFENRILALDMYSSHLRHYRTQWADPSAVIATMDKAMLLDASNMLLPIAKAEALIQLDRAYEALDVLNAVAVQNPLTFRGLVARGMAQLRLHMPSLAIHDFTKALELHPNNASVWAARGAAKLLAGDLDTLCDDLEKACSLGDCQGLANVRTRNVCQ